MLPSGQRQNQEKNPEFLIGFCGLLAGAWKNVDLQQQFMLRRG